MPLGGILSAHKEKHSAKSKTIGELRGAGATKKRHGSKKFRRPHSGVGCRLSAVIQPSCEVVSTGVASLSGMTRDKALTEIN